MLKAFLEPKFAEHEVNGAVLHFYPASLHVAFQVKNVLRPLVTGLTSILTDTSGDRGHTSTSSKDGYDQFVANPVSVELAEFRAKQKEKAVLDFVDAFSEKRSTDTIIRIIMDSLRNEFPRRVEQADINNFADSLDMNTYVQLLMGVFKANRKIFGPFEGLLRNTAKLVSQTMETKVKDRMKNIGDTSVSHSTVSSQEDIPTNPS